MPSQKPKQTPTPEAKALSLFLMAYKSLDNAYKEEAKWINRRWDLVQSGELEKDKYQEEVLKLLDSHGGYLQVIEKTVRFYINKKGAWKSGGEDKYSIDARKIADDIIQKEA